MESNFALHVSHQTTMLFERANMASYFKLPLWGVDLQRAWKFIKMIEDEGNCLLTGFDGHLVQVKKIMPRMEK